ncbi:hypothetical protein [Caldisphaera sp.]|uniref:hypothetical protein n=1 Tax=Caldisphaera sp. TaxID=2060322 RepID=UPI00397C191D
MNRKRSISEIVAVVMLIIVAISASILLYVWLNGLVGSVHYNDPSLYVKIEITSANITHKNNYIVYAYVQNLGSATSISSVAVLYYNNSLIFFNNTPSGNLNIPPKSIGLIYASNNTKVNISPGTPVIIEVITSNGVEATYQTNWP